MDGDGLSRFAQEIEDEKRRTETTKERLQLTELIISSNLESQVT